MNRYIIRAAKYLVYFIFLFAIMFSVLGAIEGNFEKLAIAYFSSRGLIMLGFIFIFSLTYPFFGFTKKTLTFDASKKVEEVQNVMNMCGYKRAGGTNDAMIFEAATGMKKFQNMWEDTITINTVDELSTITGPRKEIVRANLRFGTYIS